MTMASPPAGGKPFILLDPLGARRLVAERIPGPEQALVAAAAAEDGAERCFRSLRAAGQPGPALRLLCAALRRRVLVWFGWACVDEVLRSARAHRQALAARGEGGMLGLAALAEHPPDPAAPALFGVDLSLPFAEADFQPPSPVFAGCDLADPASWPSPSVGPDGRLAWLPPALQFITENPLREPTLAEEFFLLRRDHLASLAPAERAAWLERDAAISAQVRDKVQRLQQRALEQELAGSAASPATNPASAHSRLGPAIDAKGAEIRQAVDACMAQVKGALAGLPRPALGDLGGDSAAAGEALAAARSWILDPSDEKGLAAYALGERCQGMEMGAGLVAQACRFSGTSMAPPGMQPIPPPPALAPGCVFTALEIARNLPDSGRTPAEWCERFLDLGEEVAAGLCTWDALLHGQPAPGRDWAGREGFGRDHARPGPG